MGKLRGVRELELRFLRNQQQGADRDIEAARADDNYVNEEFTVLIKMLRLHEFMPIIPVQTLALLIKVMMLRHKSMGSTLIQTRERIAEDGDGCIFLSKILPVNSSSEVHSHTLFDSLYHALQGGFDSLTTSQKVLTIVISTLGFFIFIACILLACIKRKRIGRLLPTRTSRGVHDLELGYLRNQQQGVNPRVETADVNDRRPTSDARTGEEVNPDTEINAHIETTHVDDHQLVTTGNQGERWQWIRSPIKALV
ncbi:hypothetical protein RRF57_007120 [Xylaria bambusicola]|uniref:Uncharacterized protein n=1 Tax=Xylaria bambusicola TaxID=326684 RepID=A0AAN7UT84_9PEZI